MPTDPRDPLNSLSTDSVRVYSLYSQSEVSANAAIVVRRRGLVFSAPKLKLAKQDKEAKETKEAEETKDEQDQEQEQKLNEGENKENEVNNKRGVQYYCAGNGVEDLMIRSRL